jgi:hypothetical protein
LPDYESPEKCILKYKTDERFNDNVIVEYIDRVLIPYRLKHNFYKLYFIFDSAKCHTTPKVLNHLEKNNIEAIIVPSFYPTGRRY